MACEIVMYINFSILLNLRTGIGVLASLLKTFFSQCHFKEMPFLSSFMKGLSLLYLDQIMTASV